MKARLYAIVIMVLMVVPLAMAQTPLDIQAFRYEEKTIEGKDTVDRVQYPLAEKERLDQEAIQKILQEIQQGGTGQAAGPVQGPMYMMGQAEMAAPMAPQVQQGQDPQAVATWTYFWRQLQLWQRYIAERIFYRDVTVGLKDILNFADPGGLPLQLLILHQAFDTQAAEVEKDTHAEDLAYQQRLQNRANQREAYAKWLDGQKEEVIAFATQWARKLRGEEVTIDGNLYLISSEPLRHVPRNAVNIVTNRLTPYDIVNDNGTLKSQSPE
jgi:hypothetical protein